MSWIQLKSYLTRRRDCWRVLSVHSQNEQIPIQTLCLQNSIWRLAGINELQAFLIMFNTAQFSEMPGSIILYVLFAQKIEEEIQIN
jgi:hypothetical protein